MSGLVLIVDDQEVVRTAIRRVLDFCDDFQVCGDAENGEQAIEKVVELKPDIILMDINMSVMDGITAAAQIRRLSPAAKIVFLTVHDGEVFRNGTQPWADGFVPKDSVGRELISTLHRVASTRPSNSGKSRR